MVGEESETADSKTELVNTDRSSGEVVAEVGVRTVHKFFKSKVYSRSSELQLGASLKLVWFLKFLPFELHLHCSHFERTSGGIILLAIP